MHLPTEPGAVVVMGDITNLIFLEAASKEENGFVQGAQLSALMMIRPDAMIVRHLYPFLIISVTLGLLLG